MRRNLSVEELQGKRAQVQMATQTQGSRKNNRQMKMARRLGLPLSEEQLKQRSQQQRRKRQSQAMHGLKKSFIRDGRPRAGRGGF